MLIGALAIQFFGNAWASGGLAEFLGRPRLRTASPPRPPGRASPTPTTGQHYFQRFVEGMGISEMLPNQIFVWMPVFIGGMVAAGLLPILSSPRELVRTFARPAADEPHHRRQPRGADAPAAAAGAHLRLQRGRARC